MGRSSVVGIAKNYLDSLKSARDDKHRPRVLLVQLGLPFCCGVAAGVLRFEIPNAGDLVTGVSIVASLMCGVATLLFQTRIDLRERVDGAVDCFLVKDDLDLVDELFAQVMWSILSGFLLVLILLVKGSFVDVFNGNEALARVGYGLVWCLVLNFVLTVGIVLKRINRVYQIAGQGKR